jgi:hypothetical protein
MKNHDHHQLLSAKKKSNQYKETKLKDHQTKKQKNNKQTKQEKIQLTIRSKLRSSTETKPTNI